jgi:hypothetical protein
LFLYFFFSKGTRGERPAWWQHAGREHLACRENVAIFDQTSFGKINIKVSLLVVFPPPCLILNLFIYLF